MPCKCTLPLPPAPTTPCTQPVLKPRLSQDSGKELGEIKGRMTPIITAENPGKLELMPTLLVPPFP